MGLLAEATDQGKWSGSGRSSSLTVNCLRPIHCPRSLSGPHRAKLITGDTSVTNEPAIQKPLEPGLGDLDSTRVGQLNRVGGCGVSSLRPGLLWPIPANGGLLAHQMTRPTYR